MLTRKDRRTAIKAALSPIGNTDDCKHTAQRPDVWQHPHRNSEWWRVYWAARELVEPGSSEGWA